MSTTLPVNLPDWTPTIEQAVGGRPRFSNPVVAHVYGNGSFVGELDAYLQWDGDFLLARVALPALPGHVLRALGTIVHEADESGGALERWVRRIDVTIEHIAEPDLRGLAGDAPAAPARRRDRGRGRRVDDT